MSFSSPENVLINFLNLKSGEEGELTQRVFIEWASPPPPQTGSGPAILQMQMCSIHALNGFPPTPTKTSQRGTGGC